jgi:hypothetical protein
LGCIAGVNFDGGVEFQSLNCRKVNGFGIDDLMDDLIYLDLPLTYAGRFVLKEAGLFFKYIYLIFIIHLRSQMVPPNHLLLDRSPITGPLISRWELEKLKEC